jgi:membrane protein DedA with SNARE-associated domain/membrane-associated phospholipid phosphatase
MDFVRPYLDYFALHPTWALFIIFLIAFGEALLIIGLFVPSTAVLVGAGILVGSGHLDFWPVFLVTTIGAVAGDQVSFWAGRFFGDKLRTMWPLNRFPQLMERGEDFVRSHGGKSIALGRFVPGVKAVVPGIVGMLGMGELYFLTVNLLSALVWTAFHLLPGILIGQGLALAGELSGRLAIVLLELLVILAIAGWLIRLFAALISPYRDHFLGRLSNWTKTRNSRSLHRLGRAIAPENPRSLLIVFFSAVALLGLIALGILASGVVAQNAMPLGDLSIHNLMREVRNAPADEFMIPITLLGDAFVLRAMMVAIVGWLVWRRAWRAAIASSAVYIIALFAHSWMKVVIHRPRPLNHYAAMESFSFPSGHATMAAVTFGILAVLSSHAMNRWSRSLVYATCGIVVIAISYTRLYLGVHWMTDILGGLLFGIILVAAFGVAIEAIPPRRIRPFGLLAAALSAFVIAGTYQIANGLEQAELAYAPLEKTYTISDAQWRSTEWQKLPTYRIDLVGKPEELFSFQWAGSLDALQSTLVSHQWVLSSKWTWKNAFSYLDPNALLASVAPRPALHEGLKAKLTMTFALPDENNRRLVMRAFKTSAVVTTASGAKPIFLISLTQESLRKTLHTYTVPVLIAASEAQVKQVADPLVAAANTSFVAEQRPGVAGALLLIAGP